MMAISEFLQSSACLQNMPGYSLLLERLQKLLHIWPDNGGEFTELIQTQIFKERGIELRHGAPRTPQTQGGIESFHKFQSLD